MSCGTSCSTCSSCSDTADNAADSNSASSSSLHSDSAFLESRIREARAQMSAPLSPEAETELDELFNEIGLILGGYNAQSVKPLLAIFDELGPKVFLDSCLIFLTIELRGHLLAWAFEFAKEDPIKLVQLALERDSAMIEHVNKSAAFHECFPGNSPVGRVSAITKSATMNTKEERNTLKFIQQQKEKSGIKNEEKSNNNTSDCSPSGDGCSEEFCCQKSNSKKIDINNIAQNTIESASNNQDNNDNHSIVANSNSNSAVVPVPNSSSVSASTSSSSSSPSFISSIRSLLFSSSFQSSCIRSLALGVLIGAFLTIREKRSAAKN